MHRISESRFWLYTQRKQNQYFFKMFIYFTPMGLIADHEIFFASRRMPGPFILAGGLWSMPALSLWYLGLVALLHVGSYIPNQGLNKDWVPFVARQVLNLEFLWPPGMSCEKSVFWRSYLHLYNHFFIHNNHFSSNNTVLSDFSSS